MKKCQPIQRWCTMISPTLYFHFFARFPILFGEVIWTLLFCCVCWVINPAEAQRPLSGRCHQRLHNSCHVPRFRLPLLRRQCNDRARGDGSLRPFVPPMKKQPIMRGGATQPRNSCELCTFAMTHGRTTRTEQNLFVNLS